MVDRTAWNSPSDTEYKNTGTTADAAWTGAGNGSVISILKRASNSIAAVATSVATMAAAVVSSRFNMAVAFRNAVTATTAVLPQSTTVKDTPNIVGMAGASFIGIMIPAGFLGANLTFKVSSTTTGHVPLRNAAGAVVTMPVVAAMAYALPAELLPWANFIITTDVADNTVAVTSRTMTLVGKA